MAFRFRRSVRLIPGVRVNLGKRGISLSGGMRGANVTLGRGGLYANAGVPGTGMSVREKISGRGAPRATSQSDGNESMSIELCLDDDGKVTFKDESGAALTAKHQKLVREQQSEMILGWLDEQCEDWNKNIDSILNLHHETPKPTEQIKYVPIPFDIEQPSLPQERSAGIFGLLSAKRKKAVEQENASALNKYEANLSEWDAAKAEHEKIEKHNLWLAEEGRHKSKDSMEEYLEMALGDIDWPRETDVSFEVSNDGRAVFLDVDLPEVEDMPTESATVAARGFKINVKKRSETQVRKEYMSHIHAVAFRVIGEVFAALPRVTRVVLSGYSQRPDPQTGQARDEYLLSVSVDRDKWLSLNFNNIDRIDHVACFEIFDVRRDVSKTGVFKPIEPLSVTS